MALEPSSWVCSRPVPACTPNSPAGSADPCEMRESASVRVAALVSRRRPTLAASRALLCAAAFGSATARAALPLLAVASLSGCGALSAGQACDTSAECAEGLQCLYWDPGCSQRGVCGVPPGLDGSASCAEICSCEGYWEPGHVTTEAFQSRRSWGPNTSQTCGPPDASVPDGWDPFARASSFCRD